MEQEQGTGQPWYRKPTTQQPTPPAQPRAIPRAPAADAGDWSIEEVVVDQPQAGKQPAVAFEPPANAREAGDWSIEDVDVKDGRQKFPVELSQPTPASEPKKTTQGDWVLETE